MSQCCWKMARVDLLSAKVAINLQLLKQRYKWITKTYCACSLLSDLVSPHLIFHTTARAIFLMQSYNWCILAELKLLKNNCVDFSPNDIQNHSLLHPQCPTSAFLQTSGRNRQSSSKEKLLYSEENHPQQKKTTYWVAQAMHKWCIWLEVGVQNI